MENSDIEDKLDKLQDLFDKRPKNIETGLDVEDSEMIQLRKACRLLKSAGHLKEENGYYTVIIETSFAGIERTLQFYLLEKGLLEPDEYVDHREVYERSQKAGLYNQNFKQKLVALWKENRSQSYYREGVGSKERAGKMFELSREIHSHVLELADRRHECICKKRNDA